MSHFARFAFPILCAAIVCGAWLFYPAPGTGNDAQHALRVAVWTVRKYARPFRDCERFIALNGFAAMACAQGASDAEAEWIGERQNERNARTEREGCRKWLAAAECKRCACSCGGGHATMDCSSVRP